MPEMILTIEAHIIAIRRSLWCDTCALPSVVEADVAMVWPETLRVFHRFTERGCTDCG